MKPRGLLRHIWGWVLVLLGIIGLILPVMPGWVFLIPGLVILSDYIPAVHRLLTWAKKKAGYDQHPDRDDARRKTAGDQ